MNVTSGSGFHLTYKSVVLYPIQGLDAQQGQALAHDNCGGLAQQQPGILLLTARHLQHICYQSPVNL